MWIKQKLIEKILHFIFDMIIYTINLHRFTDVTDNLIICKILCLMFIR